MQAHHEALVLSSPQEVSLGLLHRRVPQVPKGPKAAPWGRVPVGPGMLQPGAAPASASQCKVQSPPPPFGAACGVLPSLKPHSEHGLCPHFTARSCSRVMPPSQEHPAGKAEQRAAPCCWGVLSTETAQPTEDRILSPQPRPRRSPPAARQAALRLIQEAGTETDIAPSAWGGSAKSPLGSLVGPAAAGTCEEQREIPVRHYDTGRDPDAFRPAQSAPSLRLPEKWQKPGCRSTSSWCKVDLCQEGVRVLRSLV